jgi:sugar-specific transcriptional regulator TrmB
MIRSATQSIKIVQPYVQNIEELEEELVSAMKRDVKVEVVSARNRD